MNEPIPKKALGQHWLTDDKALDAIVAAADVDDDDMVLEVGPGLGTLTKKLVESARFVLAVEFDEDLAVLLSDRVSADNLEVVQQDILSFDFTSVEPDYKIVANIPYYLTSNLIRTISETPNQPAVAVVLIQKEVAERVAAEPGDMSLLSVSAQFYWEVSLGIEVPADLFTPPPKVDSQVLILKRRDAPLFENVDEKKFFQLVKAGFSARRKKLRSSLAGGLRLSKDEVEALLLKAGIDPNLRAQALSLEQWYALYRVFVG